MREYLIYYSLVAATGSYVAPYRVDIFERNEGENSFSFLARVNKVLAANYQNKEGNDYVITDIKLFP